MASQEELNKQLNDFCVAMCDQNFQAIQDVIKNGADVNNTTKFQEIDNNNSTTPLMGLMQTFIREFKTTKLLLENGAHTQEGLVYTCRDCDNKFFDLFLQHNADINAQDWQGNTPLTEATYWLNESQVQTLLERRCNSNTKNRNLNTSLHFACGLYRSKKQQLGEAHYEPKIRRIQELHLQYLEPTFDYNQQNDRGYTPLMIACQENDMWMVQQLLLKNANCNLKNFYGNAALMLCSLDQKYLALASQLMKQTDITISNINGCNALHLAVLHNNIEFVKLIVQEKSSDLQGNELTKTHHSYLDLANLNKNQQIADVLHKHKYTIQAQADRKQSISINGQVESVPQYLDYDDRSKYENETEFSAYQYLKSLEQVPITINFQKQIGVLFSQGYGGFGFSLFFYNKYFSQCPIELTKLIERKQIQNFNDLVLELQVLYKWPRSDELVVRTVAQFGKVCAKDSNCLGIAKFDKKYDKYWTIVSGWDDGKEKVVIDKPQYVIDQANLLEGSHSKISTVQEITNTVQQIANDPMSVLQKVYDDSEAKFYAWGMESWHDVDFCSYSQIRKVLGILLQGYTEPDLVKYHDMQQNIKLLRIWDHKYSCEEADKKSAGKTWVNARPEFNFIWNHVNPMLYKSKQIEKIIQNPSKYDLICQGGSNNQDILDSILESQKDQDEFDSDDDLYSDD